jgi:hypothetical protein
MKRYRSSGRVPFGGLIALLLVTIIGSLIVGGIVFAVSHLIYLIVLFPLLMGVIGGGILVGVVKGTKVRSPIIAALFGLIIGVGIIGVYRFAEYYIDFRNEITTSIRESEGEGVSQQEIDEFIDLSLEEETGSPGFVGFLKYSASLGTTITRSSGSSEMQLDEKATWIYWGVELLIVALVSAGMAFGAARQPFNEEAGEWYPGTSYVGSVDWNSRKEFYNLLKAGDTRQAFKMVTKAAMNGHRVDVVAQQTPSAPQTDVVLTIKETRVNRKNQNSGTKMQGMISAQEFADLSRMISGAQSTQPSVVQFSGAGSSLE